MSEENKKEPILRVEDLKVHFNAGGGLFKPKKFVKAVDGVSFEIQEGETFGLVGESGCGKSTTGRAIVKIYNPTEGKIYVSGKDISALSNDELADYRASAVGFVFQFYNLVQNLTALENVEFGLEVRGMGKAERRKIAMEQLELVGLADQAKKYTQQMSGGQQQRVAIARALANNPSIMLCDEATSALDSTTTAQILDLLRRINRELNVTLVVITHSLSVARNICDRVAMIDGGRIVEMGKELLEMPIRLLGGVTEALETLKDDYKLVVATKGDLLDQERKLQRSGISHYFDHTEIMTDKAPQDYQRLISSLDVAPQSFLMVGNSLKSDVLPVLSLGGHAIHVPAEAMWKHEVISGTEREYLMIHSLAELPAVLRG
mgnify:CR=1 FL=1